MNRDQIKGRNPQAAGKIKEESGEPQKNRQTENEGRTERDAGRSQASDAKARVQEILNSRNKKR